MAYNKFRQCATCAYYAEDIHGYPICEYAHNYNGCFVEDCPNRIKLTKKNKRLYQ